jgi:hypothetical protein
MIVLVGIMVLFAFGFVFMLRGTIVKSQMNAAADKAIQGYLQSTSISTYVTSCMDRITDEALYYIGMQGGVIEDPKSNTAVVGTDYFITPEYQTSPDGTTVENHAVYGLKRQEESGCADITAPQYPFDRKYLYQTIPSFYVRLSDPLQPCPISDYFTGGAFGKNTIPKLCDSNGPNKVGASQNIVFPCAFGQYDKVNEKTSIQEQIADYLNKTMKECALLQDYQDASGNIITAPSPNEPSMAQIILGQSDFKASVTYPLKVSIAGKPPITKLVDFTITKKVRLKQIYELASNIITSESLDLSFGPDQYADLRINPRPTIMKLRDSCLGCTGESTQDDLLVIIDPESIVYGESWRFQTAIQNRAPALEWIHRIEGNPLPAHYDLIVLEGNKITLEPQGYDPDEDEARTPEYLMKSTYEYIGWKATYEQENILVPGDDWKWHGVRDGDATVFGGAKDMKDEGVMNNVVYENIHPNQPTTNTWTESAPYKSTDVNTKGRVAEYETEPEDVGPHEVVITIKEPSGKIDYQKVHILVADICGAGRQGIDAYGEDWKDIASLEDPYILEECSVTPYDEWEYTWTSVPEGLLDTGLSLLLDKNFWNPGITKFQQAGPHKITLTIKTPTDTGKTEIPIDVWQCLPYKNEPYPANTPHPYSGTGTEFIAGHVCCDGEGKYRSSANVCYEEHKWSCYEDIYGTELSPLNLAVREVSNPGKPAALVAADDVTLRSDFTYISGSPPLDARDLENDIFYRNYVQSCSGNRGNVCSGDVSDKWEQKYACEDFTHGEEQVARCQGPPDPSDCSGLTSDPGKCTKYTDTTFEQKKEIRRDNNCIEESSCGSPSSYKTDGIYTNDGATCGASGCDKPISPRCEIDCGAACEEGSSKWSADGWSCYTNCNDNCQYTVYPMPCSQFETYCAAGRDGSGFTHDYCYYAVSCGSERGTYLEGNYCPRAGHMYPETGPGRLCYTQISGTTERCTSGGSCNVMPVPEPENEYFSQDGMCYYNCWHGCDANSGWVTPPGTGSCWPQSMTLPDGTLGTCTTNGVV